MFKYVQLKKTRLIRGTFSKTESVNGGLMIVFWPQASDASVLLDN